MKLGSKFTYGFTKRACLHCAISKAYKGRDMQFFLQNAQNETIKFLKMFKYNMEFTRGASSINSKVSNRDKNSTFKTLILCYFRWPLLSWIIEGL